jgi:cytochrome c-type biogenesis protein CcmF
MTAELGHYAIVLAFAVAIVQGIVPMAGAARDDARWMALGAPAALLQFALVAFAFGCLTTAYVTSDFSLLNVAQNSHSAKPMLYKITGVWGNHEGSLLLWALILTAFGAAVAAFGANLPESLKARVLSVQALVGIGFLAFILFTSNPFERLHPVPPDGRGLNPLLQDPGLAFHPPFLYLGYVGLSVAFSFAVAALIEGRVDPAWARWVRPWTLAAWCFLTLGIALGSWWAYYELGWGGWWFWDPVENASFMPWLAGTALLHSAIVVEKRDALKSWTILLAILAFSLSLLGTFLVRSGVLTSVHAFATDPARGAFILAFLAAVVGGSLALYAARAPALEPSGLFQPISREGALVLNNLLLAVATGSILLGTLYPLLLDALTGEKVSVGPPFFNTIMIPLAVPLLIGMAVAPQLSWKRAELGGAILKLWPALLASVAAALMSWFLVDRQSALATLGLALATWLLVGALMEIAERVHAFRASAGESVRRLARIPRSTWGMVVGHGGLALVVLGIVASETWQVEAIQTMRPGDRVGVGPYVFAFEGVADAEGENYKALRGRFVVTQGGRQVASMEPEQRRFTHPPMTTTEAAILPNLARDLYATVGDPDSAGGYGTRLYFKPLVSWIWLGALVMAFGGALSLTDRRFRVGAPTRRRVEGTTAIAAGD